MLSIEKVDIEDLTHFRKTVEVYWQELMPQAIVVRDAERRDAYFQEQFAWDGKNNHPWWAVVDGCRVGFMAFDVFREQKRARVNNFYVTPERRRQGYGTAMMEWLFSYLDGLGVERIDLDVRRDNPQALAFWQAQGFGKAGYRLRQYRDPKSGTALVGALSSDVGLNLHSSSRHGSDEKCA